MKKPVDSQPKKTQGVTPPPEVLSLFRYFTYGHLPPFLQEVSRPFGELADQVAKRAPTNPETLVALRKLLEAKDAAVRACLFLEG